MPLNINEENENVKKVKDTPSPITHTPKEGNPAFTKATVSILIVAAIISSVFLLYEYGILDLSIIFGKKGAETNTVQEEHTQPEPLTFVPSPSTDDRPDDRQVSISDSGKFAVYIGAYRARSDAEEEAGRWVAAGFKSLVDDHEGWHRVTFGRFASMSEAKAEAEDWKQAFEYGYWIGAIQ